MRRRRAWGSAFVGALSFAVFLLPGPWSGAVATPTTNENARTLILAVPGPLSGCTALNAPSTSSTTALLDLIRPSAFITTWQGGLEGEGGAVTSAELTSLTPETIHYTLARHLKWSNGASFTGEDLVAWWRRAKTLAGIQSDGYRLIKSMTVTNDGLGVTAVFSANYPEWDLLFRDLEERGVSGGCSISKLVRDPSLGPYTVTSATPTRVVLTMNRRWPLDPNRFGRVIVTTTTNPPSSTKTPYASYSLKVNRTQIQRISSLPSVSSRIGSSNLIEQITFAPHGIRTRRILVRRALSWALSRQTIINHLWGSVTFSPSVAQSAIFSQGQTAYPGFGGSGPGTQSTTTTTTPMAATNGLKDCFACAQQELRAAGYLYRHHSWRDSGGHPLTVRLGVGPREIDRLTARLVGIMWTRLGVRVISVNESSDEGAASAAARNLVDAAIFARPTTESPYTSARSWVGAAYLNTFPSGIRMKSVNSLFAQAGTIFNPVTANQVWLQLDRTVMNAYWVRPLYTAPTLLAWSNSLVTVNGSTLVNGFVDQVPTWSLAPPAATP